MFIFHSRDFGIDLGTTCTLIYEKGQGIVLNEPSVIAVDADTGQVLALGQAAKEMIGRTSTRVRVSRPLSEGVISDFQMTQKMLQAYLGRLLTGRRLFVRLRAVVGIPSGVTEVEKRAVEEVIRQLGFKEVYTMVEPMAAAVGSGLNFAEARGCIVVDIGGGTMDIAVLSMGEVMGSHSVRGAGDRMDEAIVEYVRKKYSLDIGIALAEQLKIAVGATAAWPGEPLSMTVSGRNLVTGLPSSVEVYTGDIVEALSDSFKAIADAVKLALEQSPPEVAADIAASGLVLVGGGALMRGMDQFLARETGLSVAVTEQAQTAVAEGTGISLADRARLKSRTREGRRQLGVF